jgi:hypothetical protein
MDPTAALLLAVVLAAVIVAAFGKTKAKTLISGVLTRDRKGRLCLVLTPARKTTRRSNKHGNKKHSRGRS